MSVVRENAVPLYHQIFLELRDDILSGTRAFGTLMPTEHELTATMGVSRITAKRALDELAANGFVERRRRTGTRVVYRAVNAPILADIDQALESLLAFGRSTKVNLSLLESMHAPVDVADKLGIGHDDSVLHATRLRSLNDVPLGQIESFVPSRYATTIPPSALSTTPLLALLQAAGINIGGGHQTIAAGAASTELAAALHIDQRAPILIVERIIMNDEGCPVLLTIASYRADRYKISIDLKSAAPKIAGVDEMHPR